MLQSVQSPFEVNGQTWQRSNSWLSGRLFPKALVKYCAMLSLVDRGCEPFLANHMLQIVGTYWNAVLVHLCGILQSVPRELLSGETVLHFRARGFPYEIDLKVHVQVSN